MLTLLNLVLTLSFARAQMIRHVLTTEQKIRIVRDQLAGRLKTKGLTLVEGSLDLYASNSPLVLVLLPANVIEAVRRLNPSGKGFEYEYVNFQARDAAGTLMSGWDYAITTTFKADEIGVINPYTGFRAYVAVTNGFMTFDEGELNLREVR